MTTTFLRHFLRSGLYLAAILLLPGALIGAPILWWLGHRRKTPQQPTWKACSRHNVGRSAGASSLHLLLMALFKGIDFHAQPPQNRGARARADYIGFPQRRTGPSRARTH